MFAALKIQNISVQNPCLTWALSFPSIYSFNKHIPTAYDVPGPVISPEGL